MRMRRLAGLVLVGAVVLAGCSGGGRSVSVRSASAGLALPDVTTTTVDPTVTTVPADVTTTTVAPASTPTTVAPTATTVAGLPTPTTMPAVTTTVAPVSTTTIDTVPKPSTTIPVVLRPASSLTLSAVVMAAPATPADCPMDKLVQEAVDTSTLSTAMALKGVAVPAVLFRDQTGSAIPERLANADGAMKLAKQCFEAFGGKKLELALKAPPESMELAQAVKAQVDGLGLTQYLLPVTVVSA